MLWSFIFLSVAAVVFLFAASRAANATGSSADVRAGSAILCVSAAVLCGFGAFVVLVAAAFT